VTPAGLGNILGFYGTSEEHFGFRNSKMFVGVGCSDIFVRKFGYRDSWKEVERARSLYRL
jgi:hypothetical protein